MFPRFPVLRFPVPRFQRLRRVMWRAHECGLFQREWNNEQRRVCLKRRFNKKAFPYWHIHGLFTANELNWTEQFANCSQLTWRWRQWPITRRVTGSTSCRSVQFTPLRPLWTRLYARTIFLQLSRNSSMTRRITSCCSNGSSSPHCRDVTLLLCVIVHLVTLFEFIGAI